MLDPFEKIANLNAMGINWSSSAQLKGARWCYYVYENPVTRWFMSRQPRLCFN